VITMLRCFFTGWIFKSRNAVLLIEQITPVITLIAEIILTLGTFIFQYDNLLIDSAVSSTLAADSKIGLSEVVAAILA
jgi:hypothetical protein